MAGDPTLREMSGKVSIVGVGDTDYGADYRAARTKSGSYVPLDSPGLAALAFQRAVADSGLKKEDIDGLGIAVQVRAGVPATPESMAAMLGIKPVYTERGGIYGMIRSGVQAILSGKCQNMALIYGNAQRTMHTPYGGEEIQAPPAGGNHSYYYYHPWGWSGQPAHWSLMFKHYQTKYGGTEEQLGAVAVTTRKHAMLNENAVMRSPLTIKDYLDSRYVVRPLHLFDFCLVNDGGCCVILRGTDRARDMAHTPVLVAGWGEASGHGKNKMHYMVEDLCQTYLKTAGDQAFAMAGMKIKDINHFQPYDHGTPIVPIQLEGFGFCKPGEGLEFCQDGRIGIGGALPVNTSGGMTSESYMQAWNQTIEAVRQLRHEAGARQVKNVQTSLFCFCSSDGATPFIYQRGA